MEVMKNTVKINALNIEVPLNALHKLKITIDSLEVTVEAPAEQMAQYMQGITPILTQLGTDLSNALDGVLAR